MEAKLKIEIKRTKPNEAEIEVYGETYTLLVPLAQSLLSLDNVEFAGFDVPHPLEDKGVLYVRVKDGDPISAVFEAINNLKSEYSELKSSLLEELDRLKQEK
jgi:DNA-directed RNA polymerase subunit L